MLHASKQVFQYFHCERCIACDDSMKKTHHHHTMQYVRRTHICHIYVATTHLCSIFISEKLRIHIAFDKSVHTKQTNVTKETKHNQQRNTHEKIAFLYRLIDKK